ncbi:MAG TPA: hypothetical protein VMV05_03870 [bacterium]|nr:hypothetical protein [bacterium]
MAKNNSMFQGMNRDPFEIIGGVLDRCLTRESFDHLNLYQPEGRALTGEEKDKIFAALFDYARREIYWNLGRSLSPEEFQLLLARLRRFVADQGLA